MYAGIAMDARTPAIAITTMSSISVKPRSARMRILWPISMPTLFRVGSIKCAKLFPSGHLPKVDTRLRSRSHDVPERARRPRRVGLPQPVLGLGRPPHLFAPVLRFAVRVLPLALGAPLGGAGRDEPLAHLARGAGALAQSRAHRRGGPRRGGRRARQPHRPLDLRRAFFAQPPLFLGILPLDVEIQSDAQSPMKLPIA